MSTLATNTTTNTTCTACLDPVYGTYLLLHADAVCHPCFRQLFILALTSESSYPASWAGNALSAARYERILGPDLLAAYEAKSIEYACPAQERVFCSRTDPPRRPEPCNRFVGQWREARVGACVRCEACMWYTCLRCEETFSTGDVAGIEATIEHECDPRRDGELEERAFRGLKRGKDWQICPNERCKRRIQLHDGCNHVQCVCRIHFCFICGEYVRDGEGHWRRKTGCPRFGHKNSKRAIYDEEDAWDDNADVGDELHGDMPLLEDADGEQAALRLQVQMIAEMREELEQAEEARMRNMMHRGEDTVAEGADRRRDDRRRRRRSPHNPREMADELWRARQDPRARAEGHALFWPQAPVERESRRRGRFRAFIGNAVDAIEDLLTPGSQVRRR